MDVNYTGVILCLITSNLEFFYMRGSMMYMSLMELGGLGCLFALSCCI